MYTLTHYLVSVSPTRVSRIIHLPSVRKKKNDRGGKNFKGSGSVYRIMRTFPFTRIKPVYKHRKRNDFHERLYKYREKRGKGDGLKYRLKHNFNWKVFSFSFFHFWKFVIGQTISLSLFV